MGGSGQRSVVSLSTIDRAIVALHGLLVAAFGIFGFVDVDADWASLQRFVIAMIVGLWIGGIAVSVMVAHRIQKPWLRAAVLAVGPLVGFVLLVAGRLL